MIFLELFLTFFKIGLLAVGGGLATLPFLIELAVTKPWISFSDISNMVAISESTPGPLGINMATYVGFLKEGLSGSLTAVLGIITPSVIIILTIAKVLTKFKENTVVKKVFYGIRPASLALVASAFLSVSKLAFFGDTFDTFFLKSFVLAVFIFILSKKVKWHPVIFILISAVCGIVFKF